MKIGIALLCLLPAATFAVERRDLDPMLAIAANATGQAYIEARVKITDLGTNAMPVLADAIAATNLTWQQHLAARICYERLARKDDIETLRNLDWRKETGYDRNAEQDMMGPGAYMKQLAERVFSDRGLWYYYLELIWKDTKEGSSVRIRKINMFWPSWCQWAIEKPPEQYYLPKVMIEHIENDPKMMSPETVRLYRYLRDKKISEAVPVLVATHDVLFKRECSGIELFPGQDAQTHRQRMELLLAFADSRHTDLIEKYIGEHAVLAPLKEKLAEVKARPAPAPTPEPPFRLGTKLVELK